MHAFDILLLAGFTILMLATWFGLPRIAASLAARRVAGVLAPGEEIQFQVHCKSKIKFPTFFPADGTVYVTDQRLLWKTDWRPWTNRVEEISIADVIDATVTRTFGISQVLVKTSNATLSLTPYKAGPLSWPFGSRSAETLAKHIEQHPQRWVR